MPLGWSTPTGLFGKKEGCCQLKEMESSMLVKSKNYWKVFRNPQKSQLCIARHTRQVEPFQN